jgi:hypothetical protein
MLNSSSQDSSVGIAVGYGLDGQGSIPVRRKSVQNGAGAQPFCYSVV